MYQSLRTKTLLEVIWILIRSIFLTTFAFGAAVFLFKMEFVSRVFFIMLISIGAFFIGLEKAAIFFVARFARKRGYNFRKILIVGTGRRAVHFIRKLEEHPEWGLRIVGKSLYCRR